MKSPPVFLTRALRSRIVLLSLPVFFAAQALAQAPAITVPPLSKVTVLGQSVSFVVSASGGAPLAYEWTRNGQTIVGATAATLTIPNAALSDRGWYLVSVTNTSGAVASVFHLNVGPQKPSLTAWGDATAPMTLPAGLASVVAVSADMNHSLALKSDGTVAAWGDNSYGQSTIPENVSGRVAIAAGKVHNLALGADGTILGWGGSGGGLPIPAGLSNVVAIAAGNEHSMALRADGTVVVWGYYQGVGAVGIPAGLANVVAIASGADHSLALKRDGTVVAWGYSDGNRTTVPVGLANVVAISAGAAHSLALRSDRTMAAWGRNDYGQTSVPAGLTDVVEIAAGGAFSVIARADGNLRTWGYFGSVMATLPPGVAGAVNLSAGWGYALALIPSVAPVILTHPLARSATVGGSTTFSVGSNGTPPLTYQWHRNNMPLADDAFVSGAYRATLSINNALAAHAGSYTVTVSNNGGSATSNPATLVMASPPVITSRPLSRIATVGQSLSFTVAASGGPHTYQWKRNGRLIHGATDATLNLANIALTDRGHHEVIVTNTGGGIATSVFRLDVGISNASIIQLGTNAIPTGLSQVVAIDAGSPAGVALQADGSGSVWSSISPGPANVQYAGVVGISTAASNVIVVKSDGTVSGQFSPTMGDIAPMASWTQVVAASVGKYGALALHANGTVSHVGNAAFFPERPPPGLSEVVAIAMGRDQALALKSDGTVVKWGGGGAVPGSLHSVVAVSTEGNGFANLALKSDGTVFSWYADNGVELPVPEGLAQVVAIAAGNLALKADGTVVGWVGKTASGSMIGTPAFASLPAGLNNVVAVSSGGYALAVSIAPTIATPPVARTVKVGDAVSFSVAVNGTLPFTYRWKKNGVVLNNDGRIFDATGTTLSIDAVTAADAGVYSVVVTNSTGSVESSEVSLTVNVPPTIVNRPLSRIATVGQPVVFSISATDPGTLSYQWRRNGGVIAGATNATLTLPAVALADRGSYEVIVSNAIASSRSVVALEVTTAAAHATTVLAWGGSPYGATTVPATLGQVVAVAAGEVHSVALKADGTVAAWGAGSSGQTSIPAGLNSVIGIAAGYDRTFALKADGTVVSWGGSSTVPFGLREVISISACVAHYLALRSDRTVVAWGPNAQLVPAGLTDVIAVAAGSLHGLALKSDGTVTAWGTDDYGQATVPLGLNGVVAIAAGHRHSLALKSDGSVVAWGRNDSGQTAVPSGLTGVGAIFAAGDRSAAVKSNGTVVGWPSIIPANLSGVISLASGVAHDLAIVATSLPVVTLQPLARTTNIGTSVSFVAAASGIPFPTYQWKKGTTNLVDSGRISGATTPALSISDLQLDDSGSYTVVVTNSVGGVSSNSAALAVVPPPTITTRPSSFAGTVGQPANFTVTATGNGGVSYQWKRNGQNIAGATGATLTLPSLTLSDRGGYYVVVTSGEGGTAISVFNALVAPADSLAVAWGSDSYGLKPLPAGGRRLIALGVGQSHSLGLKSDRTVIAWGGSDTFGETTIPAGLNDVVAVAAGFRYSLALKADGTVVAWGENSEQRATVPPGLNGVVAIAAGHNYWLALKADGTVMHVGANQTMAPVPGLRDVVALSGGGNVNIAAKADGTAVSITSLNWVLTSLPDFVGVHSVSGYSSRFHGLKLDGTVVGWGSASTGLPAGLSSVVAIASGEQRSLALKSDGTVVAWGNSSEVPAGLNNVFAVAAGYDVSFALVAPVPPSISTPPVEQVVAPGGAANFSVIAAGTAPLFYQWFRNGALLPGATNASLALTNVQAASTGMYSVSVSNAFGSLLSGAVALRGSNPLPAVGTPPQSQSVIAGQTVSLSVAASGSGSLGYQWRRDGAAINGATNATLNLGAAGSAMNGRYDVLINDGLSLTISQEAAVTVAPASYPQVVRADPAFTAGFELGGGYPGGFQRLSDGRVIAFGQFSRINGTAARNVARLSADGSVDSSFVGAYIDGTVYAVAAQADGKLVIGGVFNAVDGLPRAGLARLNANGTLDASFAPGGNFFGVFTLALQVDGKVVLGGGFSSALARVNVDGSTDSTFAPAPSGAVNAVVVQSGGLIVVGGNFTTIAGASRSGIARLYPDGTIDPTFAVGTGFNAPVYALRVMAGERVLAGGAFTTYNGATVNRIVRLGTTGTIDGSWVSGTGFNSDVYTLEVQDDGRILAGGAFGGYNGTQRLAVARLTAHGPLDPTFAPLTFSFAVIAISYLNDGSVLVGGGFSNFGSSTQLRIARLSEAGNSLVAGFAPGLLSPSAVSRIAPVAGGKVMVVGPFGFVNGGSRSGIARLNANGTIDASFNITGTFQTGGVSEILVQPDGKLVLAYASRALIRVSADGAHDSTFSTNFGLNTSPVELAALPGGRLLLVGSNLLSSPPHDVAPKSVIAVNPDGTLDATFNLGALAGGSAAAAIVQPDGRIIVAGAFGQYNNLPRGRIARLFANGALDPAFVPEVDAAIHALALQPDGKILLAGDFLCVNHTPRARVARLNADGTLDHSFNPDFTLGAAPNLLRLQPDGRILLGGSFTTVSSYPAARHLIRLGSNGALDTSFCSPGLIGAATDLALLDDGSLLIAGSDLRSGDRIRVGLMKTVSSVGPEVLAQPVGGTITAGAPLFLGATVAGGQGLSYQWSKNGTAINGATAAGYFVASAQASDAGTYAVRVSHSSGSLDSAAASVTITPSAPVFSSGAGVVTGFGGAIKSGSRWPLEAPSLSVGTQPVAYQWSRNGVDLPGATARTYFPSTWQPGDSGSYQVTISNAVGNATTPAFTQLVTPSIDWDWRVPGVQGNSLFEVRFLNGRFLAGGLRGTIASSADGQSWSVTRLGISNSVFGFAHGNGIYVALSGFSGIWSSSDGAAWTQRASGVGANENDLGAISFGAGRFVAMGGGGTLVTSLDGVKWSPADAGITATIRTIAFGGGRFVALGDEGRVFASSDGLAWSETVKLARAARHLDYGAGKFAAAIGNHVFLSADGTSWTEKTLDTTAAITALQFTGSGFLATVDSTTGRYWISADGTLWTEQNMGLALGAAASGLTFGAGRYIMIGPAPETLLTSANGLTWTRLGALPSINFTAAAVGLDGMVAVASNIFVRIGADGSVSPWTASVAVSSPAQDIAFGSGTFVAVSSATGSSSLISTSVNGVDWRTQYQDAQVPLFGVNYHGDRFIVVGANGTLRTSPEGTTWTTRTSGTAQTLHKTAFGAGVYVAVGAGGTVLTSSDSVSWIARNPNGIISTINDVIFAAGKFVLISEGASIRTSADGLTWTPQANPLGVGLKALTYGAGKFFAFTSKNTNYLTSPDGVTWTAAQHGNANANGDAVVFGDRLYLVGANASIVSLPLNATAPVIGTGPATQIANVGGPVTFSVAATGTAPFRYQWFKDGTALLGATEPTLSIGVLSALDAGSYSVMVTNAAGSVLSGGANLTVNLIQPGFLASQARATAGAVALRGAFTVEGSAAKPMLIRAVGPTLANFSVSGFLADPTLTIASTATETEFAANNDWESAANAAQVASVAAQLGAYPLLGGSKDAAVLASFPPGTYRVVVGPVGDTGIASLEIYDASSAPRLVYVATRAQMGAAGSFAQGVSLLAAPAGRTYLIRALGPSMGLTSALADPELRVFSGETQLAANDNWGGSAALINLANNVGAMPIPPASKDAALSFTPNSSGAYTIQVAGVGGSSGTALLEVFESDAQRAATVPVAVVSLPNNLSGTAGQTAKFGVVAVGKPAPTFQWSRNGIPIAGAVDSTLLIPSAQVGDAGTYSVRVSNGGASAYTASATLAVAGANNATHGLVGRGYIAGSIVTLTTTLHFVGAPASLTWNVELPAGWSFASDTSTANQKPSAGATGTVTWSWTTPPASPQTFTYTLNVPAGETTARTLTPTFLVGGAAAPVVPAALTVGPKPPFHSADTDGDYALSLFELTRVIELYNTRSGTVRTGAYRVDVTNLEDGFGADSTRVTTPASALIQYHSADTRGATTGSPRDGMIDLFELTRVIELYNTRAGTVRTGRYRVQVNTEDGFAAEP